MKVEEREFPTGPLGGGRGDTPISEQILCRIFSYRIAGKDDILKTCQKISSDEKNPQEIKII